MACVSVCVQFVCVYARLKWTSGRPDIVCSVYVCAHLGEDVHVHDLLHVHGRV